MSTVTKAIAWMAALIAIYLLVTHGVGTQNAATGLAGGTSSVIAALQGR